MYYVKAGLDLTPEEMEKLEAYLKQVELDMPALITHLVRKELRDERINYDGHD